MQSLGLLPHCLQNMEAAARQLGIPSLWLGTRTYDYLQQEPHCKGGVTPPLRFYCGLSDRGADYS